MGLPFPVKDPAEMLAKLQLYWTAEAALKLQNPFKWCLWWNSFEQEQGATRRSTKGLLLFLPLPSLDFEQFTEKFVHSLALAVSPGW